jgi:hypothetical protein
VYNLSRSSAALRLPSFNTEILGDVGALAARARHVAPVTTDIALSLEHVDIQVFPAVALERGGMYDFAVFGAAPRHVGIMTHSVACAP